MLTWKRVFKTPPTVLAVVGMAKNVGKTVTMNYIQNMLYAENRVMGLTSIGRDGESFDALTNLKKPPVVVLPGTLVATAEKAIVDWAKWEHLQDTEVTTSMGKIVIVKAKENANVVLAGPSKNSQLRELWDSVKGWGADCMLIDGAFDRQSAADPAVSRQVILATGATLSRNLQELVNRTQARVEQLTLPKCEAKYQVLAQQYQEKAIFINESGNTKAALTTLLLSEKEWQKLLSEPRKVLILKGAIGEGLGEALVKAGNTPVVILDNGSKLFLPAATWRRLMLKGVQFYVRQPIELLGVTINPTFPGGEGLEPDTLLREMGEALHPIPVADIMREKLYA